MTNTPLLRLPYVAAEQARKHVTVNESLRRLDALLHLSVVSRMVAAPPASPSDGARYIIPAGAGGLWSGKENMIAAWQDGAWSYLMPRIGWSAWVASESRRRVYNGASWIEERAEGGASGGSLGTLQHANGAVTRLEILTTEATCSSGSHVNAALPIPAPSVVFGLTGRVAEAISGATSWQLGVSGSANRYGSGLGIQKNSYAHGLTSHPLAYYERTPIRVTASGGDFSGGRIVLAIHFMRLTPPSSL